MFQDLKPNHYRAILIDPPWRFNTWNKATAIPAKRGVDGERLKNGTYVSADVHYKTMTIDEIKQMPVPNLVADDCVMFMWATCPMLIEALNVMMSWGFVYKTCAFVWMKAHVRQLDLFREDAEALMGMGYWTRANAELCLLGAYGNPKRIRADVRMGIIEPRREHSRKPDCVRERIEQLVEGPYLELFSRSSRDGWDVWGDEVGKFDGDRSAVHTAECRAGPVHREDDAGGGEGRAPVLQAGDGFPCPF